MVQSRHGDGVDKTNISGGNKVNSVTLGGSVELVGVSVPGDTTIRVFRTNLVLENGSRLQLEGLNIVQIDSVLCNTAINKRPVLFCIYIIFSCVASGG